MVTAAAVAVRAKAAEIPAAELHSSVSQRQTSWVWPRYCTLRHPGCCASCGFGQHSRYVRPVVTSFGI